MYGIETIRKLNDTVVAAGTNSRTPVPQTDSEVIASSARTINLEEEEKYRSLSDSPTVHKQTSSK
jgi:hypothetical protein